MSLPDEDVQFLDQYAQAQGYESRSAVVHKAVRLLRAAELGEAYSEAWSEWTESTEAAVWDVAVGDRLVAG